MMQNFVNFDIDNDDQSNVKTPLETYAADGSFFVNKKNDIHSEQD